MRQALPSEPDEPEDEKSPPFANYDLDNNCNEIPNETTGWSVDNEGAEGTASYGSCLHALSEAHGEGDPGVEVGALSDLMWLWWHQLWA